MPFKDPKVKISRTSTKRKTVTRREALTRENRAGVLPYSILNRTVIGTHAERPLPVITSESHSFVPSQAVNEHQDLPSGNRYIYYRDQHGEDWLKARDGILDAACASYQFLDICCFCGKNNAIYKYLDCGPSLFFCTECVQDQHHKRPLHIVEKWQVCRCLILNFLQYM